MSQEESNIWESFKAPEITPIKPERTVFSEEELEAVSQYIMAKGIDALNALDPGKEFKLVFDEKYDQSQSFTVYKTEGMTASESSSIAYLSPINRK